MVSALFCPVAPPVIEPMLGSSFTVPELISVKRVAPVAAALALASTTVPPFSNASEMWPLVERKLPT
jgi:hypothetical protein